MLNNLLLHVQKGTTKTTCLVNSSTQAIRMRSAVAGLFSWNSPSKPASLRAAAMASLIAKKTVVARSIGGSPIACKAKC